MRLHRLALTSLLAFPFLAACGSARPTKEVALPESGSEPASERREARASSPAAAPPSKAYGETDAEESARDDGYGAAAPSPRRPGLATQWGEERDSRVREVFFQREQHEPAGLLRIHYDDERGVEAATGRSADSAYPHTFPIRGGALTVSITDDDGDPLPALHANGTDYVIGDSGDRYQIEIKNYTGGRFEIVTSVDGLDVLDGQDGGFDKRGYLISPWGSLTIEGFRDTYDTVRAFRFGDVESSYAVRRGKGRNVGVIGVAVFEEQGFRWGHDDDELRRRQNADPFPGRFAPAPY